MKLRARIGAYAGMVREYHPAAALSALRSGAGARVDRGAPAVTHPHESSVVEAPHPMTAPETRRGRKPGWAKHTP